MTVIVCPRTATRTIAVFDARSQASPFPFLFQSAWVGFEIDGQLSVAFGAPSRSTSTRAETVYVPSPASAATTR